ncbi:tetratricopeptide repeat protein [Rhodobacter ferrooxidans]|uniref:TPR repeat-containing protein n=1 Tax=Rhodobacter ferrooxidans TaxID=371731 RepID=C8S2E8_9RHOB|nr:tetratricopeptide repeat protein [Rhodobacter sp. SW2]EEW24819.1 TPR repeat-containing protein [Rhodobacter sp. SW2]
MTASLHRPFLALALAGMLAATAAPAQDAAAEAMTESPMDSGAYLAARVAGMQGDYRAAASWFTRTLLTDPTNPGLLEGAIVANIGLGEFGAAVTIARQMQKSGIVNGSADLVLLADQAKTGDFAGILAAAAEGRNLGPLLDGLVLAWAELGNGRMSEALAAFDTVAKTEGMQAFGLYHKALALASVGDFEGADDILSGRASGTLQATRRSLVAFAEVLSQLERNADAIELLTKAFEAGQDPAIDAMVARLTAGETLPFDVARNATDGIAEVFFSVAAAMQGQADPAFVLLHTRVAGELRPDHTEALLLTAGLLEEQGQHDLATETFAQVPATDPAFYVAEMGRAAALYSADKKDAAIEVLQALSRSNAQIIAVQSTLGDMLRREDRFEEAGKAYDAAIALITKPEAQHWVLYYARGICHERQKRWELAEPDLRRALELSPEQPLVMNYLGYSFVEMNQNLDEALTLIERAASLQPDSGAITDSLAWALFRLGRYDQALEPMEKASLLEPVDPVVTDHLGDVYWAVGRKLEARFQWRRALSFDPVEKDAVRIRQKLEQGLDAVLAAEGAAPLPTQTADGN